MTAVLNFNQPTLVEYTINAADAAIDGYRLFVECDNGASVCVAGQMVDDRLSFNVPTLGDLSGFVPQRVVVEATVSGRSIRLLEDDATLASQLLTPVQLTPIGESIADSLPSSLVHEGHSYQLTETFDVYGTYRYGDRFCWAKRTNGQLQILGDIVAEAFNNRDPQFDKMRQEFVNRTIGPVVEIIISGIEDNVTLEAKVDTGASYCSLDAQDITITPDSYEQDHEMVLFTFRGNKYRALVDSYQVVKTSDGSSNRPVVVLTVTCNGQVIENVAFNLDDRSTMDYDVLLGMNFLDQTNFLIDPSKPLHECVDLGLLNIASELILNG